MGTPTGLDTIEQEKRLTGTHQNPVFETPPHPRRVWQPSREWYEWSETPMWWIRGKREVMHQSGLVRRMMLTVKYWPADGRQWPRECEAFIVNWPSEKSPWARDHAVHEC